MTGPFSGELAIFLHEAKKTVKLALITKGRRGLAAYHVDVIGDAVPADAVDCQLEFPANQRRENENRFLYIEPRRAAGLVAPTRPPTSGLSPSSRVARPPAHPEAISAECRESQNVERWRTVGEAAGEGGGGGDDGKESAVCILPGDVLPGEASDLSGENLFAARLTEISARSSAGRAPVRDFAFSRSRTVSAVLPV